MITSTSGGAKIKVTVDIDANGIIALKVKFGKKEKIKTITNDRGRLSAEEIGRSVKEAEEFDDYNTRHAVPAEIPLPVSLVLCFVTICYIYSGKLSS